jgi:arylsulfatase A-like enzyme
MVSKVDSVVGRVVADLQRFTYLLDGEERSLFNDTIIIFSSDNGGMSEVYFYYNFSYCLFCRLCHIFSPSSLCYQSPLNV